jgi:hypothetical protein
MVQATYVNRTVDDYVTLKRAARIKNVSPNAVYLWMHYNNVPRIKIGRTILVHAAELDAYNPRVKVAK